MFQQQDIIMNLTPNAPFLPVCYCSNRAAALLKLNKLPKAWADAEQAMQLNPDWEKGYMRAAAVAEAQQRPEQVSVCWSAASE
jgi:tetratricopeptide (TPR) repeat protein